MLAQPNTQMIFQLNIEKEKRYIEGRRSILHSMLLAQALYLYIPLFAWYSRSVLKQIQGLNKTLVNFEPSMAIERNGMFDKCINKMLSNLQKTYEDSNKVIAMVPAHACFKTYLIELSQKKLCSAYEQLEQFRVHVIEHDVDADTNPTTGPFSNVDDLINDLNA